MFFRKILRSGLFAGTPVAERVFPPPVLIAGTDRVTRFSPAASVDAYDLLGEDAVMDITFDWVEHAGNPRKSAENDDAGEAGGDRSPDADRARSLRPKAETGAKGRVLLVDDDEAVRETLGDLLEIAGFLPIQAGDTQQALTILRQMPDIDVLVTDLTMPGDDGIALIRQAREIRHDLPAILLTGYAEESTSIATVAGGNFHVLRKPVESDHLVGQLELLMARSNAC
jgi:CheY-like chemotaxis protein